MHSRNGSRRIAAGVVGAAAALFATAAAADIAVEGGALTMHESMLIEESPVAIWERYGGYCDIDDFVPVITECEFLEGSGEIGTVRRLTLTGIGDVVEVMTVKTPNAYSYDMTEGFLADANYRATIWTVPGPSAGIAEIHWRATMDPEAFPDDGGIGMAKTLSGVFRDAFANLKRMVE